MPVKIRLQRVGKRDQPLYRLVVADQHAKANGATLAILGSIDLNSKPVKVKFDKNEFGRWVSKGAQLSETVRKLISL